jgi:hypothetical protein
MSLASLSVIAEGNLRQSSGTLAKPNSQLS